MGTQIFLFSFSSRLVMTIKLIIRVYSKVHVYQSTLPRSKLSFFSDSAITDRVLNSNFFQISRQLVLKFNLNICKGCSLTISTFFFIKASPFFDSQIFSNKQINLSAPYSSKSKWIETMAPRRLYWNYTKFILCSFFVVIRQMSVAQTAVMIEGITPSSCISFIYEAREIFPWVQQQSKIDRMQLWACLRIYLQVVSSVFESLVFQRIRLRLYPSVQNSRTWSYSVYGKRPTF